MTGNDTPNPADRRADDIPGIDRVVDAAPADPAPDLADILRKAETEVSDLRDAWLRAKAETENVRRMGQADLTRAHKYATERFAVELLAVRDALEQALATSNASPEQLREGVELTLKALASAFDKSSIVPIDPAGERFDPNRHQAMAMIPSSAPAQTVVQVFQKGYLLHDRVLRPALVAVSSGPGEATGGAAPDAPA
ncbi:Protein GrpE [Burkholderiales bacterium]|nr:Protein GrpE [Burkholderiales bacterium]